MLQLKLEPLKISARYVFFKVSTILLFAFFVFSAFFLPAQVAVVTLILLVVSFVLYNIFLYRIVLSIFQLVSIQQKEPAAGVARRAPRKPAPEEV